MGGGRHQSTLGRLYSRIATAYEEDDERPDGWWNPARRPVAHPRAQDAPTGHRGVAPRAAARAAVGAGRPHRLDRRGPVARARGVRHTRQARLVPRARRPALLDRQPGGPHDRGVRGARRRLDAARDVGGRRPRAHPPVSGRRAPPRPPVPDPLGHRAVACMAGIQGSSPPSRPAVQYVAAMPDNPFAPPTSAPAGPCALLIDPEYFRRLPAEKQRAVVRLAGVGPELVDEVARLGLPILIGSAPDPADAHERAACIREITGIFTTYSAAPWSSTWIPFIAVGALIGVFLVPLCEALASGRPCRGSVGSAADQPECHRLVAGVSTFRRSWQPQVASLVRPSTAFGGP